MNNKDLFFELYNAKNEFEVESIIKMNPDIFHDDNWTPLGNNSSNFGVIENQQSSPVAALIEKITNSIDATLMKRCLEEKIDPKSKDAPKSMNEAIETFYSDNKNWDLTSFRKKQSEDIQIIADGYYKERGKNTSLIIYDNGEGQHPERFEKTFLSLLEGNKNDILFVQGKYNMGGSGAIVFCGKKSYQLIASRRYDESGDFGFTLVREHPLTREKQKTKKNTWYEFLKIEKKIPSFKIDSLNLGLFNRKFVTGSIIKLYSYGLPSGSRSVISRDLNQSINEYLFEPALPILTVDTKERYPEDRNPERDLFGLKRRLEQNKSKYIEDYFSEEYTDDLFGENGKMKVTCYVFKTRIEGKTVKESKDTIRREFFKNNMSVLFSLNGQVHGHFTSEFITRSLKLNLLKNHLIIHVDCTNMDYNFRKDLFMASRDRLKQGDETAELRKFLAKNLGSKKGRLAEIEKRRKDSIAVDSGSTKDLLKDFTKELPMNSELMKLLNQTFKIEQKKDNPKKDQKKKQKVKEDEPFKPERFPSKFKLKCKNDGEKEVSKIPLGGERSIYFDTDVENHYFDRIEEPGELRVALLKHKSNNESKGGKKPGKIEEIDDVFNVNKSSPKNGSIRIALNPKEELKVGEAVQMRVTLTAPGEDFEEIFWVKISDKESKKEKSKKEDKGDDDLIGLPDYGLVYKEKKDGFATWEEVETLSSETMEYKTVMYPLVAGENLEKIFINMDSHVLKTFKSKYKNVNEEQLELSDKKYISSVYFHTLFLYTITKNRKYKIMQEIKDKDDEYVDLGTYLKDIFETFYSEFILNFGGTNTLMQGIGDQ